MFLEVLGTLAKTTNTMPIVAATTPAQVSVFGYYFQVGFGLAFGIAVVAFPAWKLGKKLATVKIPKTTPRTMFSRNKL